jgi:AcrR family transcriptional regulator
MSSGSVDQTLNSGASAEKAADSGAAKGRPRERIIAAAKDLFHKNGIRGIGVDAIAEAAGTNKMTLYRHFGSKDELVVACLSAVAREADEAWTRTEAHFPGDPPRQLLSWVHMIAQCMVADGRGCDLANAAVELAECRHPAKRVVEECKISQRNRLVSLCEAAGASQPSLLADALSLLLEGARVSRQSVGAEGPSARFVRLSEAIIESFGVNLSAARMDCEREGGPRVEPAVAASRG